MNIDYLFLIYFSSVIVVCGVITFVKTIMEIVEQTFRVGEFVYAKMKFYAPWPALILAIQGRRAQVQYFGWQNQW